MTSTDAAHLLFAALQAATIVALLVQRRRRAQERRALQASEEQFRLMTDRAPAMMWTARPDTTLDYLSRGLVEFLGLPIEQVRGNGWMAAVLPEDLDPALGIYYTAVEARKPFVAEYRARRADGVYRWLLDSGAPKHAPDGSYSGYIGCVIDITERKEAETRVRESEAALQLSQRQLRELAGRLIEAQDAERARIARDLHDDVSQQLAGLSIALSNLKRRIDAERLGDDVRSDVQALHQRTATLAQNVRDLSHDLHPTVLRHAGLVAALTSHCAELERAKGPVLTCRAEGYVGTLPSAVELCLYRIAQEALRNVVAHSEARKADVTLARTSEEAELTIVDDGKGFDVALLRERRKGLGLVSIAERVRLVGGTLSLVSEVGQGTALRVQVPLGSTVSAAAPDTRALTAP